MKKIILILLLVILGFAICKNRVEVKEQTEENLTEENFNNKEETSAYINQPKFNCSVDKMCEVLKKDKNLKLQNNKKLCIFEDKNEKFEIQIGAWDTEISEIYICNNINLIDKSLFEYTSSKVISCLFFLKCRTSLVSASDSFFNTRSFNLDKYSCSIMSEFRL